MLPTFPDLKALEKTDRQEIEQVTKHFLPYSDYNFTSLWCWDTKQKIRVGILNNNLIVRFTDYLNGEEFFSFMGRTMANETANRLLLEAEKIGIRPVLSLIPEETAKLLDSKLFLINEDRDGFDYVYPIENLSTYKGNKLGAKRNFLNRFTKNYKSETRVINLNESLIQQQLLKNFSEWASEKGLSDDNTQNELSAIKRLFLLDNQNIVAIGIFVADQLVGFSIDEVLNNSFSLLHFEKGKLNTFVGLFPFIMQQTTEILKTKGSSFLNYEQDMGIPGLRKGKMSYHPSQMLKKYTITKCLCCS